MMEATTKAFSNHDAKAWAEFCTPTAPLVSIRGESMEGVAEIEKGLAMVFATRARTATLLTLDVKDNDAWKIAGFHNTMVSQ
jgi:ketosteroid isomerase-like protein